MRIPTLVFALVTVSAHAAIYSVEVDGKTLKVHISIAQRPATAFRMPAWAPGDYRIVNFGKWIRNVEFTLRGKPVEGVQGDDPNLWTIEQGADGITYSVSVSAPGLFSENLRITPTEVFIQPPSAFGYFVGRTSEKQELHVAPYPNPLARAECALERTLGGAFTFTAQNYDVLLDSPLVMGTGLKTHSFAGNHAVVAFGRSADVSDTRMQGFGRLGAALAQQARNVFGELPYTRYLFLFDIGGPGGGLEHADCARLALWPGTTAESAATFIAHEYFHCYNVKRIRSKPLGPFDYTKPAVTGALWWLEGVTDYYAEVLTFRAGYQTRDDLLSGLSEDNRGLLRRPARLKVSADECSRRVWEANNSTGYGGLDYYQKGKLIGWCLDMAIRAHSKGERSLDDVMAALFQECKGGKPGFEEGRIRELCVQFGGEALGPLYDRCVLKAEELPLPELLPLIGMKWENGRAQPDMSTPAEARSLGANFPNSH